MGRDSKRKRQERAERNGARLRKIEGGQAEGQGQPEEKDPGFVVFLHQGPADGGTQRFTQLTETITVNITQGKHAGMKAIYAPVSRPCPTCRLVIYRFQKAIPGIVVAGAGTPIPKGPDPMKPPG